MAGATHGGGTSPDQDKVTGSTKNIVFGSHVRIEAHSGPQGQNPRGRFYLEQDPMSFGGEITCLNVSQNLATIGGRVDRSRSGLPLVGTGWLQAVEDNGEPGDMDKSDTAFLPVPPLTCQPPQNGVATVDQGNLVVHDAP